MENKIILISVLIFCVGIEFPTAVTGHSFEEDTALTSKQVEVLLKFKNRVRSRLPHKYMEEDIFLVKWLRARNFDVNAAEEMLLKNIKWRTGNKMDKIDEEDWRDFEADFPWLLEGKDKHGRPLVQIILREWDVRQAVISGHTQQLQRWIYKYLEDSSKMVRQLQTEGQNVTRFTLLMDAEGFNAVTHGCPLCVPIYLTIAGAFEEHFPGSVNDIHVVNTPEFFRVIIRLVWPLLSEETRGSLKMYGSDKNVWKKTLSETIDQSQLLPSFGGALSTEKRRH